MIIWIFLFVLSLVSAAIGFFFILGGFASVPLAVIGSSCFVVAAVFLAGACIVSAIVDLEKVVRGKGQPPPLPK